MIYVPMSYQNSTPLVLIVPLFDVEVQALVYGDRTASGTAGGLAGEYAGIGFLRRGGAPLTIREAGSGITHLFASFAAVYGSCPKVTAAKRVDDSRIVVYIGEAESIETY